MPKQISKKKQEARRKLETRRILTWIGIAGAIGLVFLLVVFLSSADNRQATTTLPDTLTVAQAYESYQEGVYFLDVRTQEEWDQFHAPEATLIPLDELPDRLNEVPKGEQVVVICRTGNRSGQAQDILQDAGYTMVSNVDGGMTAWADAGYPVIGTPP